MYLIAILLFLLQPFLAFSAQESQVLQGKLKNGMSYYVKENHQPKGKAFLQLVVKVGSVNEQEHERGIAHFLEHLNFRGSKHFADGELDQIMQSLGGADRNAMTGFQTTTYYIDLPIEKEGSFDQGLLILHDFAGFASLNDEAIAKERHVVLDEMNQDFANPDKRRFKALLAANFPNSHLVNRFPIGTKQVISTVTPETLRTFYKKWYRPDRMAVMVVGDFDGKEVEKKVQKLFGEIMNPPGQPTEPDLGLTYPKQNQQSLFFDPELENSGVELIFSSPSPNTSRLSLMEKRKTDVLKRIVFPLLGNRLDQAKEEGEFYEFNLENGHLRGVDQLFVEANFFEKDAEKGMTALFGEIERIKSLGFTSDELNDYKREKIVQLKGDLENLDKLSHEYQIREFENHFFYNDALLSNEKDIQLTIQVIDSLTLDDLNKSARNLLNKPVVALFGTSSESLKKKIESENLFAYGKRNGPFTQFSTKKVEVNLEVDAPAGMIQKVTMDPATGITQWVLSNGIKVLLKQTDLEKGKVYLSAVAKGGLAQFPEQEFASASFAEWGLDGLKGLSSYEKKLFLEDKGITINGDISLGSRTVDYTAQSDQLQTAFQLVHQLFTNPQFDQKAWDKELHLREEMQMKEQKKPAAKFSRFVKQLTTANHYAFRKTDLKQIDQEDAKKAFYTLFGHPADFTFVVVGDFETTTVETFVKKYIASLHRGEKQAASTSSLPVPSLTENVEKEFLQGQQDQVSCVLYFPVDVESVFQKHQTLVPANAVVQILKNKLWQVLRAEHGKTYGVDVKLLRPFSPDLSFAQLQVEFSCQPEDRQLMTDLAIKEVEKVKNGDFSSEEIDHVKASYSDYVKGSSLSNPYWLATLKFTEMFDISPKVALDQSRGEKLLTNDGIMETASTLFSYPNHAIFYHMAE